MRAGVPIVLGPESKTGINPEEVTLAEALKERGYRTMAIGKWHLGHRKEEFLPNSNGFDEYFGLLYSNDMQPPWVQTNVPLELFRNSEAIEYPVDQDQLTKRYTEEAVRFIRSAPDKPFFVYLAYSMPHVPIHTFKEMQGRSRAGLYGDVIETIDWSAGEILKTLQSLGIDDNTIVVFTSDNGPWLNMPDRMFEEGKVKPWHAGSAGSLRGWKHQTYEGGMRVPGIVRWPNRVPSDQVSAEVATTLDLYVSLVEAAGGLVPDDRPIDGRNILRLLEGKGALEEEPFFYIRGRQLQAVRVGRWKLRVAGEGEPELFDLEVDPSERYNLAVQHPKIVTDLANQMVGLAGELGAGTADNLKELSGTD
jgi:arylsulfatase A-like enzyme